MVARERFLVSFGDKMKGEDIFHFSLSRAEGNIMARLNRPSKIQTFLDEMVYSTERVYRCPLRVLRERMAHCFDGAVFAGLALREPLYRTLRELVLSYLKQYCNVQKLYGATRDL